MLVMLVMRGMQPRPCSLQLLVLMLEGSRPPDVRIIIVTIVEVTGEEEIFELDEAIVLFPGVLCLRSAALSHHNERP